MITSSSIPYISHILSHPGAITNADRESIQSLMEAYPYFVPARYLNAAEQHKEQPYAPAMMDAMQLYMGNRVLFSEFIQQAPGQDAAILHEEGVEEVQQKISEEPLIQPVYTEDYFMHQGIEVSNDIPVDVEFAGTTVEDSEQSLMVVMSFAEWLQHFKSQSQKAKEEAEGQKALRSMWQKEKLAAAMEEENEEIPENVFEMAMNSIASEEGLVSESLAEIYIKQKKYDGAIEMYKKLSLRNPQKSAYFARKIDSVLKDKQS